ncbi:hypothetical protein ACFLWR_00680 [Chloroflexota bacterium]
MFEQKYNYLTNTWEYKNPVEPVFKPLDIPRWQVPPISSTIEPFRPNPLGGPIGHQIMARQAPPIRPYIPCYGPFF